MPKRAFYTVATGKFVDQAKMLENSLRKFDQETEFIVFGEGQVQMAKDPNIFYRSAPYFAKKLFDQGYDEVCKLDSDQIILGNLDHIWEGEYDAGVVLNDPTYQINVWDIQPYFNNGLVVLKSQAFVEHWLRLCYTPHFDRYQFKEQDLLNILCSDYMNYTIACLDFGERWHGEFAKPFWAESKLKDGQVVVTSPTGEKQILVYHSGGGHDAPDKMNYRIRFPDEVTKFIDGLVK